MICTPPQNRWGDKIKKEEMDGDCSMLRVKERHIQGFGGEI